MDLNLRKFAKFVDKTFIEGEKKAKDPVLLVSVAAVIKNPWIGKGFVEDLKPGLPGLIFGITSSLKSLILRIASSCLTPAKLDQTNKF